MTCTPLPAIGPTPPLLTTALMRDSVHRSTPRYVRRQRWISQQIEKEV